MLKELFLLQMPEKIRLSLCVMHDASLDQLAQAADRTTADCLKTKLDAFIEATKNIQGDHFTFPGNSRSDRGINKTKTFNQRYFSDIPRSRVLPNQNVVSSTKFCCFHNRLGLRVLKCSPCS